MIKLMRILAPVDDTPFSEICSFETENYIGVFVDTFPTAFTSGYVIMPKSDSEFSFAFVNETTTLEQLDEIVFRKVEEHITAVSTSRCLDIKINVSFDLIKPRLTQGCFEGLWIKFPDQQPICDTPYYSKHS